jgi:hypothetical protein
MFSLLRQNSRNAFFGTVFVAIAYHACFLVVASRFSPESLWSLWGHVTFVWVPMFASGMFFFWMTHLLQCSRWWLAPKVLLAAITAPQIALLAINLLWYGSLPVIR